MTWSLAKVVDTARRLVEARLSGAPRDTYAGADVPANLHTAYAIQSEAIKLWEDELVGFKVGGIPPKFREQYPADWLAGPVFARNVYYMQPHERLDFPVYQDGFAAFEPELILEIQSDVYKSEEDWTAEKAKRTIERVYVGAEIAASPNMNVNVLGPGSIISDFGNNVGIIIGPEVPLSELDNALAIVTETRIDGEVINKCPPGGAPGGPLGALAFLLDHLRTYHELYDLPDRLFVSSGAITGVHESHVGAVGELEYDGIATLTIRLVDGAAKIHRS